MFPLCYANKIRSQPIKLWNQLVVFSKTGKRLLESSLIDVKWPGVSQSVTNWMHWHKEAVPKISIADNGATATLSVEDPLGVAREFQFVTAP